MMRRREFITLLGGAAMGWPLVARAQQPAMPMVGFLSPQAVGSSGPFLDAFRRGLAETGHVEGQNVAIEHRMAGGQLDRLPALAADLVRLRASVIATSGTRPRSQQKPRPSRFRSLSAFPKTRSGSVWSRALLGRAAT